MFAVSENMAIFALRTDTKFHDLASYIFCAANNKSGSPAADSLREISVGSQNSKGGSPLLAYTYCKFFRMRTDKNLTANAQGAFSSRRTHETGKSLYSRFLIEKNAKNAAYAFILSCGLLSEFAAFSRACHSDDPHRDCVDLLTSENF